MSMWQSREVESARHPAEVLGAVVPLMMVQLAQIQQSHLGVVRARVRQKVAFSRQ
jgi:hypothetical protein